MVELTKATKTKVLKQELVAVVIAKPGVQYGGFERPVGSKINVSKTDAEWMKQRKLIK